MTTEKRNGALVSIIAMMFLFAMISFVTNMAAPFGTIWDDHYSWAGMMGNMMNFAAYLFMGIPAGILITKIGYKKTALVALALGFIGMAIQYLSSTLSASDISTYIIYLIGAFICGFCVCILNTVVNPMLNQLGGGGNRGNQLIQTGGSLNSLAATLTPMLVGMLVGETTEKTSLEVVQPLLFIAIAIFLISFCIIYFTRIQEPDTEAQNVVNGVKGAMSYRHLVLGIIAIFFYVGIEVGIPWLLMLVGRFSSSLISGKVSPRAQLIFTSTLAIVLLLAAIIMPEDIKMTLKGADVPVKVLFIIICGICTSVMWGVIFNLATEGLGKFTAAASGLFMTMVVGGGVMPLIQNFLADQIGDIQSYWLVITMLGYLLFYALIGSKPVKKEA